MIQAQYIPTPPRDQWLGMRKGRMTSSLVAGALGLAKHCTPLDAWCSVTGRSDFDGNKATVRGTLLEPVVLDYPTRGGHLSRRAAPFALGCDGWTADSADCLYTRADGVVVLGEGKTVALGGAEEWGAEGSDEMPPNVVVQCLWHLAHWPDAPAVIVPVLVGGFSFEFREYVVERDDELIGEIVERARRFHADHVLTDRPPPAVAGDDDNLRYLYPRHVPDKWMPPTPELERLVREYAAAHEEVKAAEARKSAAGSRIRQLLKDSEGSKGHGWKVTYKAHARTSVQVDWESLARHLGATDDVIARFTHTSSELSRTLLPKLVATKAA